MPTIEESDNYICDISTERLPGALVFPVCWLWIGYEKEEVFKIWIEESNIVHNIPQEDIDVKISSDLRSRQRIVHCIETVLEASSIVLNYVFHLRYSPF
jgi:hypothetical protein